MILFFWCTAPLAPGKCCATTFPGTDPPLTQGKKEKKKVRVLLWVVVRVLFGVLKVLSCLPALRVWATSVLVSVLRVLARVLFAVANTRGIHAELPTAVGVGRLQGAGGLLETPPTAAPTRSPLVRQYGQIEQLQDAGQASGADHEASTWCLVLG